MILLSWDVGKINMAFCALQVDETGAIPPRVVHWATWDLTSYGKTTRDFAECLIGKMNETRWMATDVDVCVIETQSRYCSTLQCIAASVHAGLYALALQSGHCITFANISAACKFKKFIQADIAQGDSVKTVYTKHKKLSQELTMALLKQWGDQAGIELFVEKKQNKDMADALTNGAAYLAQHHKKCMPVFDMKFMRASETTK